MTVTEATITAAHHERRKKNLIKYTEWMYPGYRAGWVHYEIAKFLERAISTPGFRGVIVVPPRFGKSELASVQLPGYFFGHYPDKEIIAASHTQDLSNYFSRRARRNVQSKEYPFASDGVRVSHDSAAVETWELEAPDRRQRGRYQAFGVGGSPSGRGADLLIIDDPVKNAKSAESEVQRDATWEWFQRDALSRLQPGGSCVVIGTRWHWDDMIGRIINGDKERQRWEVLHFPAMLPDGSSLDPDRWPIAELELKRAEVGERTWDALYQGIPTAEEGAIIKKAWFPEYETLPTGILHLIQSWDTALKIGDRNDYSVCHTYAVTVYGLHLVGRFKGRLEFPDLDRKAEALFHEFKPRHVYIEDKVSGISLGQSLRRKPGAIPVVMCPVPNGEGKVLRVHEATPILEAQRVHIPSWAPWKDDVLKEWTSFPLGTHDDEVDAMVQAVLQTFGDPKVSTMSSSSYFPDYPDDDPDSYPAR